MKSWRNEENITSVLWYRNEHGRFVEVNANKVKKADDLILPLYLYYIYTFECSLFTCGCITFTMISYSDQYLLEDDMFDRVEELIQGLICTL